MMRAVHLGRWLPGAEVARRYERSWLRHDLIAGVVLTAVLVPAGIGYAQAAGLPAATGLYASIVPLLAYALVGPSRILVLGPDSSLAPIIAASVLPLAAGDAGRAVALAGLLAVMMGVILVVGGLLRVGFVTDLLSKPIRVGYLNGIALVVLVGQLPKLLGFSVDATSFVGTAQGVVEGIADGAVDLMALAIGLGSLVLIIAARLRRSRVPGVAVVVVVAIVMTALLGWDDEVPVVGALPAGLPAPALQGLEWGDVGSLAWPAVGIALIAFADTSVPSRVRRPPRHVRRRQSGDGGDRGREHRGRPPQRVPRVGFGVPHPGRRGGRCTYPAGGGGRCPADPRVRPRRARPDGYLPPSALAAIVISAAPAFDRRAGWWLARVDPADAARRWRRSSASEPITGTSTGIVIVPFDAPCSSPTAASSTTSSPREASRSCSPR